MHARRELQTQLRAGSVQTAHRKRTDRRRMARSSDNLVAASCAPHFLHQRRTQLLLCMTGFIKALSAIHVLSRENRVVSGVVSRLERAKHAQQAGPRGAARER